MAGKKTWFIVDGYRPAPNAPEGSVYSGHESIMILNVNDVAANLLIDIYYEDKDPVENIELKVPPKRIYSFRSSDIDVLTVDLKINEQYSMRIRSDVEIVVQYGRLDVTQPNMAFLATLGYGE
ncbi:MAG TPA: hypothetical protein GXZ38_04815 [Spirochaetales bacterium]|jgi:hypothetical protein|nr:hypothetical protein [Spirochaetales bacterium]